MSLSKLAIAFAVIMGVTESRPQNAHPLHQESPEVESIVREDGGVSMRMRKSHSDRPMSHQEMVAMRK